MASTKIGAMRIDVGADSAQFDKSMSDMQRKLGTIGKKFEAIGAKTADMGKKLTLGLSVPMAGIAVAAVQGAQAQAAAMAQVEAAIKSMGNAAGLSGDQLSKFADGLEVKSLFDADEILKSSTANLLTFGNIAGDTFMKAQQAAVDLATRMGGDLQGATLMVGKALNDPVKGLTALSRAGIQFTDQQKAQIKAMQESGNMAGAQAIMLGELNKQFGGAAEAAAKADPMREVMVKIGQAGDVIGEKLLPLIPVITEGIGSVLDAFTALSPSMQKAVVVGGGLAAALGPVALAIGGLSSGIGATVPLLVKFGPLVATATKALAAMALTPVGAVITGIAVAVGGVYLAWKNWDKITAVVKRLYDGVKTWLVDKLGPVFSWVGDKIKWVADKFKWMDDVVVRHSYVPDMVDSIGDHMRRLQQEMVDPADKTTKSTADKFRDMATKISGIMDGLYPEAAALRDELDKLATLEGDPKTPLPALMKQRQVVADTAERARLEQMGGSLEQVPGALDDAYEGVARTAEAAKLPLAPMQNMQALGQSLADSFYQIGGKAGQAFGQITDGIFNQVIPAIQNAQAQTQSWQSSLGALGGAIGTLVGAVFGKKAGRIAGAVASIAGQFAGFRASGGPVAAGKTYVVGENGPELFTAKQSGTIIPNISLAAPRMPDRSEWMSQMPSMNMRDMNPTRVVVDVVPSPYFDAHVRKQAAAVAKPMAMAAAVQGSNGAQVAMERRASRRIPGS